jgi:putative NADPH-quinone reductase
VAKNIVIIQGHPDPSGNRLCHALADAYAKGAAGAGHGVTRIEVASLDFPLLRTKEEFEKGTLPASLGPAQLALVDADHLVFVYPLWLGTLPALLKAFLEQVARPGIAFTMTAKGGLIRHFKGKSARIIVTMGMPALLYRFYFGAHGLKSFERSILGWVGVKPIHETLLGLVEARSAAKRAKWLRQMTALGRQAR